MRSHRCRMVPWCCPASTPTSTTTPGAASAACAISLGKFAEHPASNHPQYAMHALLDRFGIKRGDVELLQPAADGGRDLLASGSMRPSAKTEVWHDRLKQPDVAAKIAGGMSNLAVVEAPNPEMEALAIAIAMREARHLDKSAALVTPDRALARRVMAALTRWDLAFDDSGGDVLMETSAGVFARLAAEAATKGLEPPTLLAMLKHPLCRLGRLPGAWKAAIEGLELAVLRGTRPPAGTAGLLREFNRFREELAKLWRKRGLCAPPRGATCASEGRGPRSHPGADRCPATSVGADRESRVIETVRLRRARAPASRDHDRTVARRAGHPARFRGARGPGARSRLRRPPARRHHQRVDGDAVSTMPTFSRPRSATGPCGGGTDPARGCRSTARWNRA